MKPKILLTGFTPFLDFDVNPTQELMKRIAKSGDFPEAVIRTRVLEVHYEPCERDFHHELVNFEPDGVISFGLNVRIDHIALERIAVNIDDTTKPDNAGNTRSGTLIVDDGPAAYWTSLPVREMYDSLQNAGIPVQFSNHAGAYLCNHLFYYGLYTVEKLGLAAATGFVHVPPFPEQLKKLPPELNINVAERAGMRIETLYTAACICIDVLIKHIMEKKLQRSHTNTNKSLECSTS